MLYLARCNTGYWLHFPCSWRLNPVVPTAQVLPPRPTENAEQRPCCTTRPVFCGVLEDIRLFRCTSGYSFESSCLQTCPTFSNNTLDRIFSDFQCVSEGKQCPCLRQMRIGQSSLLSQRMGTRRRGWKNQENCHGEDCEDCHQNHQIMAIMVKP